MTQSFKVQALGANKAGIWQISRGTAPARSKSFFVQKKDHTQSAQRKTKPAQTVLSKLEK